MHMPKFKHIQDTNYITGAYIWAEHIFMHILDWLPCMKVVSSIFHWFDIGFGVHTKLPKSIVVFPQIACIARRTLQLIKAVPSILCYRGKCSTGFSSNCVHASLNCMWSM